MPGSPDPPDPPGSPGDPGRSGCGSMASSLRAAPAEPTCEPHLLERHHTEVDRDDPARRLPATGAVERLRRRVRGQRRQLGPLVAHGPEPVLGGIEEPPTT